MLLCGRLLFFFCKQMTANDMRIRDRSSDVCSSDLALPPHSQRPSSTMSLAARPLVKAGNRMWKEIVNTNWIRDSRTGSYSKSFSPSCHLQLKQLQGRCPTTSVRLSPGGGRPQELPGKAIRSSEPPPGTASGNI